MANIDFDKAAPKTDRAPSLVPVVELFLASVQAIELANARASYEETIDSPRTVETAVQAPASPTEQFCRALNQAAEESGIPVPFFARLLWQESRFRSNRSARPARKASRNSCRRRPPRSGSMIRSMP